jgi:hypothetical protein
MADDTIGSLVAIVKATADQFAADMKKVQGSLDEVKAKSKEAGDGMKAAFEIAGAIEAVKAVMEVAKEVVEQFFAAFERAHELEHFADEIGSTAHELSALRFAAIETGTDIESFNGAIGKMTQKIGEAREGAAKTSVAFQALGLDVNRMAGESAGGQLEDIAERMKQIPNAADRAALAVELFGKKGRELLPMLMQGKEGIEAMKTKADELNATLSDDQAASLASAQKGINELKMEWQGLWNTLATAVVPILKTVVSVLNTVTDAAKIGVNAIHDATARITGGPTSDMIQIKKEQEAWKEHLRNANAVAPDQNIVARFKEMEKLAKEQQKLREKGEEETQRAGERLTKQMVEHHKHAAEEIARHAKQVADSVRTPWEKFNEEVRKNAELLKEGAISFTVYKEAAAKLANEVEKTFKNKEEHGGRSGIKAADIFTSEGASLDATAGRALQDIQLKGDTIAQEQLESLKRIEQYTQAAANAAGRSLDLGIADF